MPARECPFCSHQTPRSLDKTSADAYENYYRCDQCGAVWNVLKSNPLGFPNVVIAGKRLEP